MTAFKFFLQSSQPRLELTNPPRNWENMNFKLKRSKRQSGVILELGLGLEFTNEGYTYCKAAYDAGIEEPLTVEILKRNHLTGQFENFTTGSINVARMTLDRENKVANCKVERSSTAIRFLNAIEKSVDLTQLHDYQGRTLTPFTLEQIDLTFHSQPLPGRFRATPPSPAIPIQSAIIEEAFQRTANVKLGFSNVTIDELEETFPGGTGFSLNEQRFEIHRAKYIETGTIEWNLQTTFVVDRLVGDFDTAEVRLLYQINDDAPLVLDSALDTNVGGSFVQNLSDARTVNISLNPGDRVYLYGDIRIADVAGNYQAQYTFTLQDSSFIDINVITTSTASTVRGMMLWEAFARLCQHYTGLQDAFRSDYFGRTDSGNPLASDGAGSLEFITDGNRIRGVNDKGLVASFKDLFNSRDARHHLGWGIETLSNGNQVVRVEPRSYFYQRTKLLSLGCVSNLKEERVAELYYNEIELGYEWDTKEKTGSLEEFNTSRKYGLPITQLGGKLTALSAYHTAGVRIENQRRLIDRPTVDGDFDQENFIVSLVRSLTTFIPETNEDLLFSANIPNPDRRYNIRQSPGRCAQAWEPTIRASAVDYPNFELEFIEGEANIRAQSQFGSESRPIVEDETRAVSQMQDPLFLPIMDTFDWPLTVAAADILRANPYGIIEYFDNENNRIQGFLLEVDFNEKGDPASSATWKTLRVFNQI